MEWATTEQSPPAAMTAPMSLIRLPEVCRATGLGRSMIYQLEATQRFPRRVRIGVRAVGWLEAEVQQWIAERVNAHRA
jgi:prophage regulatory protein